MLNELQVPWRGVAKLTGAGLRAGFCAVVLMAGPSAAVFAQEAPDTELQPSEVLGANQLDDLVAPVALYPDPLLSQVLVASTYPLELVQASQWLARNPGLSGSALTQAADQQNWDPSVQALIIFPDLVKRLNEDITWTTNLGNAFLSQQGDVMDAVQRMRIRAEQAGKLSSSAQQTVVNTDEAGQPVVQIQPASPEVIYVPYYDPYSIWGPSYYYPYASWYYPPFVGGAYFRFGTGIPVGVYFGGGWGGWGGWGWQPAWRTRTIIVNNTFIHRNNFNVGRNSNFGGTSQWSHNSDHRQGVPYNNRATAQRFAGGVRQNGQPGRGNQQIRNGNINGNIGGGNASRDAGRAGNRQVPSDSGARSNGGANNNGGNNGRNDNTVGGLRDGNASRGQNDRGSSNVGAARSMPNQPATRNNEPARGMPNQMATRNNQPSRSSQPTVGSTPMPNRTTPAPTVRTMPAAPSGGGGGLRNNPAPSNGGGMRSTPAPSRGGGGSNGGGGGNSGGGGGNRGGGGGSHGGGRR